MPIARAQTRLHAACLAALALASLLTGCVPEGQLVEVDVINDTGRTVLARVFGPGGSDRSAQTPIVAERLSPGESSVLGPVPTSHGRLELVVTLPDSLHAMPVRERLRAGRSAWVVQTAQFGTYSPIVLRPDALVRDDQRWANALPRGAICSHNR